MKRYILFTIYCLLFTILAAQGLSEQKIIQKMASSAEAIRTVECNFTQTKQSKMLSKPQMSEGKMFCQQPDKLRWEYTSPRPSTLVLEGTEARLLKGNEQEARNKFIGEMARMIMNCVAGKNLTDNKTFQVSAKEMPTEYVATLVPQRKDMKRLYTKLVLHYNLKQETVTEIELHEKNGDRTLIELHDISINGK